MRTCGQSGNPGNNFKDVSSGPKCACEFSDMSLLMQQAISQSELTEVWINRKTISKRGNAHPSIVLSDFFPPCFVVLKCFQSLISMFLSESMYPEIYFLFCMLTASQVYQVRGFPINVLFIFKTSVCYFFLFVGF